MIGTFAIVMALLHVAPWLYIVLFTKYADFDLGLIMILAASIIGMLVWMIILTAPFMGFLFIFTVIYSWQTIFLKKRN